MNPLLPPLPGSAFLLSLMDGWLITLPTPGVSRMRSSMGMTDVDGSLGWKVRTYALPPYLAHPWLFLPQVPRLSHSLVLWSWWLSFWQVLPSPLRLTFTWLHPSLLSQGLWILFHFTREVVHRTSALIPKFSTSFLLFPAVYKYIYFSTIFQSQLPPPCTLSPPWAACLPFHRGS